MKRHKRNVLGISVVTIGILLAGCGNKQTSQNDNSVKIMTSDVIATMDSVKSTDVISGQALVDTMDGLYRYQGKNLKPAIATKIVKPTNNGLTYTYELRKNAKWSNGEAVSANDFVYAWRRGVDPKVASEYAYIFEGIKNATAITNGEKSPETLGVKALDKYTLEVTLEKPIPYFNQLLTTATFFPQLESVVKKAGKTYGTNSKTLVFNGPYKLVKWNGPDSSWQEVKNEQYWNKKAVSVKTLNYQVVKDPSTALNLFQSKKLDRVTLSGDTAKQMKNDADYSSVEQTSTFYIQMNQSKNPIFKNAKIRRAISMSINREELVANVLGDGSKVVHSITPANMSYNPETKKDFTKELAASGIKNTSYNPKLAKSLWQEGLKETGQTGKTLTYTLLGDDTDTAKKHAEYLQNSLEKNLPGIKINLSNVPFKTRLTRSSSGDFDLVISAWSADFPDPITFLDLFVTGSAQNVGHFSNAEYDQAVKDSKSINANDPMKRYESLIQAQNIMNEQAGVIALYQSGRAYLTNANLTGIDYGPSGSYNNVSLKLK